MADVAGELFYPAAPQLYEAPLADQGLNFPGEFFLAGGGAVPATVNYIQRVYSSGLAAWCYYTETAIDPTPASGDTTPNWTGAITAHEVLGSYS